MPELCAGAARGRGRPRGARPRGHGRDSPRRERDRRARADPSLRDPAQNSRQPSPGVSCSGAARRGKFLWVPLQPSDSRAQNSREALVAHLGMSGQLLLRSPGCSARTPRAGAPRRPASRPRRARDRVRRPAHIRLAGAGRPRSHTGCAAGGLGTLESTVPSQVAHIARDPLDPAFERPFLPDVARAEGLRDQARTARSDRDQRHRQHLRRRVALGAPASTLRRPPARSSTRAVNRLLAEVRAVLERLWPRAERASTRSTSTSTGRPGTSRTRSTPTDAPVNRARGADARSSGCRS